MEPYQSIPRKILGYLAKDSLTKIKLYLRKHHIDLGDCCTPAGASVLHVAAELGSELCLRYLMKTCPGLLSKPDSRGELPLHKAITYLISVSDRPRIMHICLDVVEPLLASYPQALHLPNFKGWTPKDLLQGSGWVVVSGKLSRSTPCSKVHGGTDQHDSSTTEPRDDFFYQKLFDNIDDEGCFNSSDEGYFNSFENDCEREEEETYDRWAERIEEERRQKQRQQFERYQRQRSRGQETTGDRQPPPCPPGDASNKGKRVLGPERPKRGSSLQLSASVKRARHESAMRHALQRPADAPPLGLAEFPWPTGCGSAAATAADMVSVLLCDVDMADIAAVRARAKELQKTWHPDKIEQRFGATLLQSARATILDKVKEIAQLLNAHMQKS